MTRTITMLAMAAALNFVSAAVLEAQAPQTDPIVFTVAGGAVHQAQADLKDTAGAFALDRWYLSAGVTYAWNQRSSIGLTIGGGKSIYDFDEDTAFGGGDPWNKIQDFRISAPARFAVGAKGSVILIPTVRFNAESSADSGDASTYGLYGAMAWRINESLMIGPGFGVFSRLEDGTQAFPILVIDWDISERWNLATGTGLAASQGPGLTLSYQLNSYWTLGLSGRYENIEFRLDEDGAAPGGVGRDQSLPLVISGVVRPNPKTSFSLFAGVEFEGELKLKDAFGELVEKSAYDPAPIIGATFELRF